MAIQLKDRSSASTRYIDGKCKITFHALSKTVLLPAGTPVTISLIERLYQAYKLLTF